MRAKPKPKISRRLASRHEVLLPKMQALARQVQARAARSPKFLVPDAVRMEAEALLFAVQPFREHRPRGELPVAAPHYGGLSAQLGEAVTALIAFEMRNIEWNAVTLEPQWSVPQAIMKVKRLAPKPGSKAAAAAHAREEQAKALKARRMLEIRAKLADRLERSMR